MATDIDNKIVRGAVMKAAFQDLREKVYTRTEVDGAIDARKFKTVGGEAITGEGDIPFPEALTEWQRNYLNKLQDDEVKSKFAVTLAVTPSSKESGGTPTALTLTATVKYGGTNVDATVTSKNGLTFTKSSTGVYTASTSYAVPTDKKGTHTQSYGVTAAYTRDGVAMSKDASATFSLYTQCRILQTASTAAPAATAIAAASNKRRAITGTYSIPVTPGQYVWLCVPLGLTMISDIKSSGFGVPYEAPVDVDVTVGTEVTTFKCYRIAGAPQSSPMNVAIS